MYTLKLLVILHLLIAMQIVAQRRRRSFEGIEVSSTKEMPFLVSVRVDHGLPVEQRIDGRLLRKVPKISDCAGTYIRPLWVLTATHCLKKQFPIKNHKPTYDINLCMGGIEPLKCPEEDKRLAKGVYPHTAGIPAYEEHDVALLSIAKPWDLGSTIQIAKLPTEKVDKKTYHNMGCMMGGWGYFDLTNMVSPILKEATVTCFVGDNTKCPVEEGRRGTRQICVLGGTGIPCQGDSGGPLLCQGVVIAVLRAGARPGYKQAFCNSTTEVTALYNLIQEYNDWIVSIAGDSSSIVPNNLCRFVIYATLYFFYILN